MGYYNMVYQFGENNFLNICKKVGVDGLILVDLLGLKIKNLQINAKKNQFILFNFCHQQPLNRD